MLYNEEVPIDEEFEGVDDSSVEDITEFDEFDENTDYDNNYQYSDIEFEQDTPDTIATPDPIPDETFDEVDPVPDPEYETVDEIDEIIIQNYDEEYLQVLEDDGYTFYVIYEDGTEDEVDISEIEEPTTSIEFLDDEAYVLANSILEHFWDDNSGVHVTQDTKEDWEQSVEANFPDLDATHPHHNIIVNSYGVLIRSALKNLVQLSRSALAFYDGQGNDSSNIISTFGRGGIQIGPSDQKHLIINNNGITVYNGDGTVAPLTASNIQAIEANIQTLTAADVAITGRLTAAEGNITTLTSSKANVTDLTAATARIDILEGDHVTVSDFQAEQANIDNLQAATADIATIRANSAKVANLTAQELEADHATVGALDTNYAQVNMANVNNAWIQNGTVKDGAITNAMINSVSANKLTAGTIDASNITVTNLNADNITAGTLNGQRIGAGTLSLDKLEEDVYTETEVDGIVQNLQTQIDGAIETWTGTTIPTLQNAPAVNWNTNSIKDTHVGDVYFVVNSQSDQNGYNYRFTKTTSGGTSTYSWQLIKDNDVTNALQRLTTAEGKIGTIEQFDSTVSSYMTNTDAEITSIKSAATTLMGRVDTAEGTLATKVDTATFNTLSQTVDGNSSSIQQLTTETTTLTEKVTLDAPYTQVEWVEFTGRQICRLNWRPGVNGAFGFEADFITYNSFSSTSYPAFADARTTNEGKAGVIFGVRGYGAAIGSYGSQYTYYALQTYASSGFLYDGGHRTVAKMYTDKRRQQCSLKNGIYTAPDGSTVDVGIPAYLPSKGYMYVSGLFSAAGTSSLKMEAPSVTRIYSLKFYDDDVLAVDLIPAIRKSDGTPGLYDSVEQIFYPSYGMLTGDTVGDLGDSPDLLNSLASSNPTLNDLRTRNSRLLVVESNDIKKLQDGQRLTVLLKYETASETFEAAGITNTLNNPASTNSVFLAIRDSSGKLIGETEHPVQYNNATSLTTHYPAGMMIQLQFRMNSVIGNSSIGRAWFCDSDYNTNTNDNARYVQWYNNVLAKKAIRNASIIVGDEDGYEEIDEDVTFDLAYPILWRTAALNINKTDYKYSWTLTYDRTLATCYPNVSGIKNQMLYLVGEPNGGKFTVKTPMLTFDTPTEADGLYYIPIGKLGNQSTGQNYLIFSTAPNPTMFAFIGDAFQQVQGIVVKTTTKLNETIDTVDEHTQKIGSLETTVATKADGSTVTTISNTLNTVTQTATSNSQKITNLTTRLGTNADGTAGVNDIIAKESALEQDLDGFKTTVSSTYTTKTEFNGLEIGGRNLVRGTSFASDDDLTYWLKNQNPILSVESGSLKMVANQTSSTPGVYTNISVEEGKYTVSFWYKSITENGMTLQGVSFATSSRNAVIPHNCVIHISDTEWHYYEHIFEPTATQAANISTLAIFLYPSGYSATDGIYIRHIKLEKGNRATDWTPAPEDTDAEISGLKTRVTTAESSITQNATNINLKVSKDGVISSINQSAESVKIDASKVEINGTAIFTNEDFREAADAAYASKASESLIETANSNAEEALQTALDGAFLVLTSTNGQLFKNGSESTILQVAVFPNGGDRCDTITQVRNRFGASAYIEWKWMHESSGEWGTLLSNDTHLSQGGMWLTVGPEDVATKTTFAASLVVPD